MIVRDPRAVPFGYRKGSWVSRQQESIALAAIAVALLAACSPTTPTSTPTPNGAPTAPATTAAPATRPEPVLDLTCDDLATPSLATLLPDGTARDPILSRLDRGPVIPSDLSVTSRGGLVCEYSNGLPNDPSAAPGTAYIGARVIVLPDATTTYQRWADGYGDGDMACPSEYGCSSNVLVGSTWVSIGITGASNLEAARTFQDDVSTIIAAAAPGAAPWVTERTLPSNCGEILSDEAVGRALGIESISSQPPHGGWSVEAAADESWGAAKCWWGLPSSELGPGTISALPGGRWALDEYRPHLTEPATPERVEITGLAPEDEAWLRCAPNDSACTLDLGIDQDWIQVHLVSPDATDAPPFDRRAGALALGAALASALP